MPNFKKDRHVPLFYARQDMERRALASSVVYYSMKSLLVVEKMCLSKFYVSPVVQSSDTPQASLTL